MILLFILGLIITVISVSSILKKQLSTTNTILSTIVSVWMVMMVYSVLYTLAILNGLGFGVFVGSFVIIILATVFIARKEIQNAIHSFNLSTLLENYYFTLLLCAGIIVFSYIFSQYSVKWGQWDAWTVWNLHAKFLATGSELSGMFLEPVFTSPDYPLFLSSTIAMLWNFTGSMGAEIPTIVAFFITLSVCFLAYSSFRSSKQRILAIAFFVILATDITFIERGAAQYADTLMSLFLLAVVVFIQQWNENQRKIQYAFIIGFFAASCGWIKNEGLLVFIIISLFFFISNIKSLNSIFVYVLGAVLPLSTILIYKSITPHNDFLSQLNMSDIVGRLTDFSRYFVIGEYIIKNILLQSYVFLLVILLAIVAMVMKKRIKLSINTGILLTLAVCYFLVYVITKTDLSWNLGTSAQRLFIQLFPAMLFVLFRNIQRLDFFRKEDVA